MFYESFIHMLWLIIMVESIILQNLPIKLFGISLIICLLCLFLCFLDMDYADI